jgi:hypothetical protein
MHFFCIHNILVPQSMLIMCTFYVQIRQKISDPDPQPCSNAVKLRTIQTGRWYKVQVDISAVKIRRIDIQNMSSNQT